MIDYSKWDSFVEESSSDDEVEGLRSSFGRAVALSRDGSASDVFQHCEPNEKKKTHVEVHRAPEKTTISKIPLSFDAGEVVPDVAWDVILSFASWSTITTTRRVCRQLRDCGAKWRRGRIVVGCGDVVYVYDAADGSLEYEKSIRILEVAFGFEKSGRQWTVGCCGVSGDGTVACASIGHTVCTWKLGSGQVLSTFLNPTSVTSCCLSPRGDFPNGLVAVGSSGNLGDQTSSSEKKMTLRSFWTGTEECTLDDHRGHAIIKCQFTPDGTKILVCELSLSPRVFDVKTGACLYPIGIDQRPQCAIACISSSGTKAAVFDGGSKPAIYDFHSGTLLTRLNAVAPRAFDCAFRPGGGAVAVACLDSRIRIFDVASGHLIFKLVHVGIRGNSSVHHFTFSPDGKRLVSACKNNHLYLWDAVDGDLLGSIIHSNPVDVCAFGPP